MVSLLSSCHREAPSRYVSSRIPARPATTSPSSLVRASASSQGQPLLMVPPHVDHERVLRLQSAPSPAVAQHDPYQLQRDVERYLCSVVETGLAGREEPCQPEIVHRRLNTEVGEGGNLRFAYDQVIDAGAAAGSYLVTRYT